MARLPSGILLFLIGIALLLPGHSGYAVQTSSDSELEVSFTEVLTIGDDPDASIEYLFDFIASISADHGGNTYVADHRALLIRVYDETGTFVREWGERGEGPGEFGSLWSANVANGEVVAHDQMLRRLQLFSLTGELVETRTADPPAGWPALASAIHATPDGKYVFYFPGRPQVYYDARNREREHEHLFYVFDFDETDVLTSFGDQNLLGDLTDPVWDLLVRRVPYNSSVWMTPSGSLLFVPPFYDGALYRFDRRDGEWYQTQVLKGYVEMSPPFISLEVQENVPRGADLGYGTDVIAPRSGTTVFPGRLVNESLGVFALNDGRIVHFSRVHNSEDERVLQVELFTEDGELVGVSHVDDAPLEIDDHDSPTRFMWKDDRDRFYVRDSETYHKVRVFEIDFQFP